MTSSEEDPANDIEDAVALRDALADGGPRSAGCYCIGRVMVAGRVVVAHADFCDAAKDVENEAEGRDA